VQRLRPASHRLALSDRALPSWPREVRNSQPLRSSTMRNPCALIEKSGSHMTHRWREMDSNYRFRARGATVFSLRLSPHEPSLWARIGENRAVCSVRAPLPNKVKRAAEPQPRSQR
jgi:hypothetical protein